MLTPERVREEFLILRAECGITGYPGAKSVVITDGIIGCPHEEAIDYPEGHVCPQCPFWAHRDRWSGEIVQ